jgi:glutamate dehydrogenase
LDVIDVASGTGRELEEVAGVPFPLDSTCSRRLREHSLRLPRDDRWQALARAALRDGLYAVPRLAGRRAPAGWCPAQDSDELIQRGFARNRPAVGRCLGVLRDIAADDRSDLATLSVALREVRGLVSSRPGVAEVLSCSRRRVASSGDQRAGEDPPAGGLQWWGGRSHGERSAAWTLP